MVIGDKLNLKCIKTAVKLGGGTAWFGACSLLKDLASLWAQNGTVKTKVYCNLV